MYNVQFNEAKVFLLNLLGRQRRLSSSSQVSRCLCHRRDVPFGGIGEPSGRQGAAAAQGKLQLEPLERVHAKVDAAKQFPQPFTLLSRSTVVRQHQPIRVCPCAALQSQRACFYALENEGQFGFVKAVELHCTAGLAYFFDDFARAGVPRSQGLLEELDHSARKNA